MWPERCALGSAGGYRGRNACTEHAKFGGPGLERAVPDRQAGRLTIGVGITRRLAGGPRSLCVECIE